MAPHIITSTPSIGLINEIEKWITLRNRLQPRDNIDLDKIIEFKLSKLAGNEDGEMDEQHLVVVERLQKLCDGFTLLNVEQTRSISTIERRIAIVAARCGGRGAMFNAGERGDEEPETNADSDDDDDTMADPPSLNIPGAYDALSSMLGRPINPTPKGQYPLYWAGCNNQTFCVEKLFLKWQGQPNAEASNATRCGLTIPLEAVVAVRLGTGGVRLDVELQQGPELNFDLHGRAFALGNHIVKEGKKIGKKIRLEPKYR